MKNKRLFWKEGDITITPCEELTPEGRKILESILGGYLGEDNLESIKRYWNETTERKEE